MVVYWSAALSASVLQYIYLTDKPIAQSLPGLLKVDYRIGICHCCDTSDSRFRHNVLSEQIKGLQSDI